jgi:mannose-1-phosphate guanylyltransferase
MHAAVFAGGVGQRLWPISRKNSPKQFSPLIGTKSSFQMAIERLIRMMPGENVYIAINKIYKDLLSRQVPYVPRSNFILEPVRRDLSAAVALTFFKLHKDGVKGPIILQWADNYIKSDDNFWRAITSGEILLKENPNQIIFLGEIPRYASENLGYIKHGPEIGNIQGIPYYGYLSWEYRPALENAKMMVKSGEYVWNSGYFVTTVEFIVEQYHMLAPDVATIVDEIISYDGTIHAEAKLEELYPRIPAMHFDESFLMKLQPNQAKLFKVNLGWSDPGTLYSLKEALESAPESNVTQGDVVAINTVDSLVINEETDKTVAVMGLNGVMIVNTSDALLVIDKNSVRYIQTLFDELSRQGKDNIL